MLLFPLSLPAIRSFPLGTQLAEHYRLFEFRLAVYIQNLKSDRGVITLPVD